MTRALLGAVRHSFRQQTSRQIRSISTTSSREVSEITLRSHKHDQQLKESSASYTARSISELRAVIKEKPGTYTLIAIPTAMGVKQKTTSAIRRVSRGIINKFRKGESLDATDSQELSPGHLAVYSSDNPEDFLSHFRGSSKHTSEESALEHDVSYMVKDHPREFYTLTMPVGLAAISAKEAREKAKPYDIAAIEDKDNCSTAATGMFGMEKDKSSMNPLQTLHKILMEVTEKLPETERDAVKATALNTGLTRNIEEYSVHSHETRAGKETTESDTLSESNDNSPKP